MKSPQYGDSNADVRMNCACGFGLEKVMAIDKTRGDELGVIGKQAEPPLY
jgi:hypothetical protein